MRAMDAAPALDPARVRAARKWAGFYSDRGYFPLPSRPDAKRPMCRFAGWWDGGGPAPDWLWDRFPTTNIQLVTGRHWRLAVIDLDGPEAIEVWTTLGPRHPRTWESTSGDDGRHLWFTLPDGLPPMPKRLVWGGTDKHKAIELLCDRSLVIAPPSIHPKTGRLYRFRPGCSPRTIVRPALMPRWIFDLPSVEKARKAESPPAPRPVPKVAVRPLPSGVRREDVLDAIDDKVALARSWGLRFAGGRENAAGWLSVHDFNREDASPSASFHPEWGLFWRPSERPMSLFDLGAAMGHYADWRDCLADLASTYLRV